MDLSLHKPIFSSRISKRHEGGCLLYILALLAAVVLVIISIVSPRLVGPWWLWTIWMTGLIFLGWFLNNKNKGIVQLFESVNGEMKVYLKYQKTEISFTFHPDKTEHWFKRLYVEEVVLPQFFFVINGNEEQLAFQQTGGGKMQIPPGWEFCDKEYTDKNLFYLEEKTKMFDLATLIKNHKGGGQFRTKI